MATIHSRQLAPFAPSSNANNWSTAFAAAVVSHAIVIGLLALLNVRLSIGSPEQIETRWNELPAVDDIETIEFPTMDLNTSVADGATSQLAAATVLAAQTTISANVDVPTSVISPHAEISQPATAPVNMSEHIPGYLISGSGMGDGSGEPGGFFGTKPNGKRIVFVVDRSLSMNHPHESEALTRFRRLKIELLTSITNMSDDMYFYIIFFSDGPTSMPARSMQQATTVAKKQYLDWMARVPAGGQTEPLMALQQALKLRPDVVYFLTDGSFSHKVERQLRKLVQQKIVINTFTFGDIAGEKLMKWVARCNSGSYTFIP